MSLLEHTPQFRIEAVKKLAQDLYGLRAEVAPLPSERDQNFLLRAASGQFVLKIANALEDGALLDAQQQAMALAAPTGLCQRVIPTPGGDALARVQSPSGASHWVRLVTYLPGIPMGSVKRHSPELLRDLGRCVGRVDQALAGLDHPAIHRDFHWDLANSPRVVREYESLIAEPEMRRLVGQLAADFERDVAPRLPGLRTSTIHNDANDYNVIVGGGDDLYSRNQRVIGLLDFGDMVHSYTAGGLAVAMAYAILDKPDPLAAAAQVVQGYHAAHPLDEPELAALFGLMCMRLCVSACLAAHQQRQRPENDYLAISQAPIRRTLPRLAQIHPRLAEATFRHACGLAPAPSGEAAARWLRANASSLAPVLEADLRTQPCAVLDLSVASPLVSGDARQNAEPELTRRIAEQLHSMGASIGIGRYGEPRLLYNSTLAADLDRLDEQPTIHLGLDVFAQAGTPVYAPLEGVLHALAERPVPTIILKHDQAGLVFYTLYRRLSRASLLGRRAGDSIAQGEQLGTIGAPDENGGQPPHLHIQWTTDLLELDCHFPGAARPSQPAWRGLSPDPNVILGVPVDRFPPAAPDQSETLAARRQRLGRNLSVAYKQPVKIVRGWMQYLYDEQGRRYLDAYNNVPHVGHCHPRVVQAAQRQMAVLNTNTRYLHDLINCYAERLCATLPEPLRVCFFVNSGSEANELALRLARAHTGRRDMIVLEAAYHGHTTSLIDISPYKHNGPGGAGAPAWVHTVPLPDVYRGLYRRADPQAGEKYAHHVLEVIERLRQAGAGLAGYIAESLPSVGGQIVFPENYLAAVYRHVRGAGGVCIADEVQTGYGRIGTHFWGFETQGVVPDIVVLGKPIGNGYPIGAVITTPAIAASFDNGMEFFSTFGGSTVSCAVGLAVLQVVLEEQLQAHALRVGQRMLEGLYPLVDRYPIIGDVRGSGLFLGVELVRDRATLEPAGAEAAFIANRIRDEGILLGTDGPFHNVIKIRPPMPFSEADADRLVGALDKILADDFGD